MRFLEQRIPGSCPGTDTGMPRLIRTWPEAGAWRTGSWGGRQGKGQGSAVSPLLADMDLHYAFDLQAERWRRHEAVGGVAIVRHADDIVAGFEHEADAKRFRDALRERLAGFAPSYEIRRAPSGCGFRIRSYSRRTC